MDQGRQGAIKWTRLSCRSFAANAVRLQLHALAYNLGNFLRTLATPEMVSYIDDDLAEHKARNQTNLVSGVKLLQGDLAEAWREGDTDFASVAMRYALIDKTIDNATGRLVKGSEAPTEATEVWTFLRPRGGGWELSGIQQV